MTVDLAAGLAPRAERPPPNVGYGPPPDGAERAWDTCPSCGGARWQLVIVPDRFYCDRCRVATPSVEADVVGLTWRYPNTQAAEVAEPEPDQQGLFSVSDIAPAASLFDDTPPLDEGMAWVGEEGPDE